MRLSSLFISFFVFVSNYITAQWVEKINPSNHTLYSVDIHESGLCYAGGIGIVKSVDYGNTWTEIVFTGPFAAYFEAVKVNSIEVVDNNTIVAVGWYAFTNRPCIIRTTDNGVNWSVIWEGTSGSNLELRDVEFFDHLNGIAVGDQYLLRTTNGGATWTNSSVSGGPYNMKSIKYLTSSIVVVVGDNIILRSNSGGAGYNTQSNGSKYFKSVDYDPLSNTVIAVYQKSPAYDSYTYTSTNLGLAWTSNQIHTDQIFSMELLTNDTLFLGYDESFRISFNDGVDDFIFDDYPFELVHDISFTNNTGLCVMGLWTDCKIFKYDYSLPLSITQNVDFSVEDSICTNSITSYAPTNSSLDSCHWFVDNVFMSNLYNFDYLHSNPGIVGYPIFSTTILS